MGHEDLTRVHDVQGSSDRAFGLVFAAVFLLVSLWPAVRGEMPRWWALAIAAVFAGTAILWPRALAVPNKLWTKLGVLLGAVVGSVALGLLFYAVLTPLGVFMRLTGKDPLRLRPDRAARSYWIPREPPGPPPDSMDRQF